MESEYLRGYKTALKDSLTLLKDAEDLLYDDFKNNKFIVDKQYLLERIVALRSARDLIYNHLRRFNNGKQSCSR